MSKLFKVTSFALLKSRGSSAALNPKWSRNRSNTSVSEQYIPVSAHTILKTIKLEDGKDIQVRAGKWGGYYLKYGQGNYSVGSGIDIRDIDQELAMDIIGLE